MDEDLALELALPSIDERQRDHQSLEVKRNLRRTDFFEKLENRHIAGLLINRCADGQTCVMEFQCHCYNLHETFSFGLGFFANQRVNFLTSVFSQRIGSKSCRTPASLQSALGNDGWFSDLDEAHNPN